MELDITNLELNYLIETVNKEISALEKEIHRTDALMYKNELKEKVKLLNNLAEKLHLVIS